MNRANSCRLTSRWLAALALAAAGGLAGASQPPFLTPYARPHGDSLADMAGAMALFTTSGNNPAYAPTGAITLTSPFRVLYQDPATVQAFFDSGGITFTGSNTFAVPAGSIFYVPIWNADDSPPIVPCPASLCGGAPFPVDAGQAASYFFDPSALGADLAVVVDGEVYPVSPAFTAGPVTTPPLLDGGGTHIITVGVFLEPLPPGRHTVGLLGGLYGSAIAPIYGFAFFAEDITYTVDVVAGN